MSRSAWLAAVRSGAVPSRLAAVGAVGVAAAVVAAPVANAGTPVPTATSTGGSTPSGPGADAGTSGRALKAAQPLDDAGAPQYGNQKVRVGVQRQDGATFPPGATLVGTQITAVQTGPDAGWDGTVTCTVTSDPLASEQSEGSDEPTGNTADTDPNAEALCTSWGDDTYSNSDFPADPDYTYYLGFGNSVTFTITPPPGIQAEQRSYTVGPCVTDVEQGLPSCTFLPMPDSVPAARSQARAQLVAAVPAAVPPPAFFGSAVVFVVRPPAAPPVVVTPPPTALDDVATTIAGTPVSVPVLANDSANGGGALNLSSVSAAAHGTAVIDGARIDYTPAAGFVGTDTFTYTASTPYGSSTAAVTVTVTAPTPSSTAPSTPAPTTSSAVATHSASPSPTRSLGVLPTSASRVPGPPLANTGVRTGDYLGTGAGLVAAGGLLTFAGRRRRRRAH